MHFFAILMVQDNLDYFILRGVYLHQTCMTFHVLIGFDATTHVYPLVAFASFLVMHLSLGLTRSNALWPHLIAKLSTQQHSQLQVNVFGLDAFLLIWAWDKIPPLSSTLIVKIN